MSCSCDDLGLALAQTLEHLAKQEQQNSSSNQTQPTNSRIRISKHLFLMLHSQLYERVSKWPSHELEQTQFISILQSTFIRFFESYCMKISLDCYCAIVRLWERLWKGRISFLSQFSDQVMRIPSNTFLEQSRLHRDEGNVPEIQKLIHDTCQDSVVCDHALPDHPKKDALPKWRFTRTKNHVRKCENLTLAHAVEEHARGDPNATHIPGLGLWIDNVLSSQECQMLIEQTDRLGYHSLEDEFLKKERDSCRLLLLCDTLSNELWKRIEPFLQSYETKPYGFLSHGTWRAKSINPCLRFCKYAPAENSVGFTIHRDGNYVVSERARSALSLIVYLNDNKFEGGETVFFKSTTGPRPNETIEEELSRGYEKYKAFAPKAGSCLLFESTWLHCGAPIPRGTQSKCIIRSDVLFERDSRTPNMSQVLRWNKEYKLMNDLYLEAAEWETKGYVDKSSELYEKALSVRLSQKGIEK
uniref:Fe2OG dioxygenase domain-containing protein n=1 Tax=Percolomonas cosmopolitus TaxID=63605 RepID=A0A7S1KUG4_9EUKA|mmetsp:Transcript_923/g.3186  ORF Transcript_923/g.3186 Transcript_923/m.3186 type:complete len:471 (+) Transcript_923:86-1498(+)